jgi:hypothetical protein
MEHLVDEPFISVSSLPVVTCACGHEAARHDLTASRYCRATASSELRRDCICNVAQAQPMSRR